MNIFGFRVSELVRNSIEINCNAFANKLPIHANLRQQVATKEQQLEMGIDKQKKKTQQPSAKTERAKSAFVQLLRTWSMKRAHGAATWWRRWTPAPTDELLRHDHRPIGHGWLHWRSHGSPQKKCWRGLGLGRLHGVPRYFDGGWGLALYSSTIWSWFGGAGGLINFGSRHRKTFFLTLRKLARSVADL